jgi:Tol biopolymer transport system component
VISADGRFVAFASKATNLVPGDTNRRTDVFVHDRKLGRTERVSVGSDGSQDGRPSFEPSISADGRFVAFASRATTLTVGDTSPNETVFVRDRQLGTTETVSVGPNGVHARGHSHSPSISADGRHVAFVSGAANLVEGDTNGVEVVFVRDRRSRVTILASVGRGRDRFRDGGILPSIAADGQAVAFASGDLVPEDTNGFQDVYIRLLRGRE